MVGSAGVRGLDRRRFVASALAGALAPVALPALAGTRGRLFDTDVAIIGAGAAGLACARDCARLNKRLMLVEARDRIGGRVFTDTSLGPPVDAGAVYIHWAERNPWTAIAAQRAVPTIDNEKLPNPSEFFAGDRAIERPHRRGAFDRVDALFDPSVAPVPDVSILERVGSDPDLQRGAQGIGRMALGDEPERISALDYARLWSGTDLLVPEGYGTLVAAFGRDLPVKLNTPVRKIIWRDKGVRIETASGSFTAATAVVTVPVGVLAAESIRFDPPLPSSTLAGINGLGMGALTKIALAFDGERFGVPAGTDLWDQLGPRASFDFECWPFGRNVVVVWFGGDQARDICRRGEAAAIGDVMERFSRLVGRDARPHLTSSRLYAWIDDPWSLGCYSHAKPGMASARAALAQPLAEKIFFAGEAIGEATPADHFGGAMTAGGAFLSGRAAALSASAALK